MHSPEEQKVDRDDLFEEIAVANVADLRQVRRQCAVTITIRHPDIPAGISYGTFYFSATPQRVFEALEAHLPAILRNLETGVPKKRRAALPHAGVRRTVYSEAMGGEKLVRNSKVRR